MSSTYAASLDAVEHALDDLATIAPDYRTTGEKKDALVRLSRIVARSEAERIRILAVSDDIAVETGARSTAHWLAAESPGDRLTAEQARRLACQAGIIPVVFGGKGEILDLGRAKRLFTGPQRTAMALRDRGRTTQGCSIPAAWCEAHHHQQPWSQGGKTNLAHGKLLCPFHHHRAHDPRWETHHHPNGSTTFHRRT